ncbi:PA14 domain protein [Symmachiella dynata]|uniref:PA14 domain protein n=1 Tax=Symmachiella dynata TaxID=2527995 RepID=A0A517ZQ27_9PLAN|nr:PA14 domain-containing protein [Symmachiella dynata]QDU44550.1 PA14 domain protein [Symmachiella dynata]
MKPIRCCFTLLALFAMFSIIAGNASAQDLPANWQQLPAADFANEVDKVFDEQDKRPAGNFDSNAVMKHAASLFLEIDLEQAATTEFPVILKLFRAGWHKLDQKQRAAVRTVLAARQDNWNGRPYEELRSKVIVMEWIGVPYEIYSQDARSWVNAGGDVSTVRDEDLHFFALFTAADPKVCRSSFTVQWEGRLTAPQTGQYTFSISPINVNATYGNYSVEQTMNVSLNGQQIISATPENWSSESQPVQLTAGQIVPIQVNMAVVSPRLPLHALHATFSWEGPGISKKIVPNEQLKLPGSDDNGLRATYTWTESGLPITVAKIDDAIDFAWTSGKVIVNSGASEQEEVNLWAAWKKQMSTQFLDTLVPDGKPVMLHPRMSNAKDSSQGMASDERKQFLEMLLTRPALLDPLGAGGAVDLYRDFRIGATELALDVFGQWAIRNANCECRMPHETWLPGIDLENREAYHFMAVAVTQELPAHADRLRDEFLELPDGSCSLPVAYVLGYSYLGRDKLEEWTELLDTRLAEESLTGDKRVNWLIARAHAQEIRLGSRNPYATIKTRPMDARYMLDTAMLAAQDPDLKLKVMKQIAARLSATRKFDKARALLDEAASLAPVGRAADIADWKASIDKFEADHAAAIVARSGVARKAYVDALVRRRDRAAAVGDSAAVDRYNLKIDANVVEE